MKEGWKVVKIKDICDKASSNIAQKDLNDNEGEYPIYGASGFIKNVDFYQRSEPYIGIVKDGSGVGRVSLYPAYSSLLGTLQYIIPKYENDISFVYYALQSLSLSKFSVGAAIPHIYFKDYGECEVAVPPLSEQHRIVKKLDAAFEKIDAMKAKAEKNIENAKALFQQTLAEELEPKEGWVEKKLGEVCEIRPNKSSAFIKLNDCDSVSFLPMEDLGVFDRFISVKKIKKIHEVKKSSYTYFENGDILLAKVTPCFENGKLGITHNLVNGIGFGSSEYIVFRPYECILNSYVYYQLANPKFRDMGKKLMLGACGLKRLSKEYVINYNVSFPQDKEIQQQIVTKLDKLSAKCKKLEEAERKTIAECDALKQAILRQAFNGEL